MRYRYLLSLDEVIQNLMDHDEVMKTLIYVVATGSFQVFKFIIELIDPESLQMSIEGNMTQIFPKRKQLLNDINISTNYSLMHYACASGSRSILEFLISRPELNIFSNDNPSKEAPLHWWISNNQKWVLPTLLKEYIFHGEDINIKDVNGHTPLFIAAIKGYQEIFYWLIDYTESDM